MHYRLRFCAAPVFVVALSCASALMGMDTSVEQNKSGDKELPSARIDELVKQLGDSDWETRDSATEQLKALGARALSALRKGVRSEDAEVRSRAQRLAEEIRDTALLMSWKGAEFRLSVAETNFLAGVLSTPPKEAHLAVTRVYSIFINGVEYVLLPDELIWVDQGEAKVWESPGVRARIMKASGVK